MYSCGYGYVHVCVCAITRERGWVGNDVYTHVYTGRMKDEKQSTAREMGRKTKQQNCACLVASSPWFFSCAPYPSLLKSLASSLVPSIRPRDLSISQQKSHALLYFLPPDACPLLLLTAGRGLRAPPWGGLGQVDGVGEVAVGGWMGGWSGWVNGWMGEWRMVRARCVC